MFGIYHVGSFIRLPPFVDLFRDFHSPEHIVGIPVVIELKTPTLWICLLAPFVNDGMEKDLI